MAAIIELNVSLSNEASVVASLTNIDTLVNKLNGKTISLNVNSSGAAAVEKSVIAAVNAQARLENATAKTAAAKAKQTTADAKLAESAAKAAVAQAKQTTADAKLAESAAKAAVAQAKQTAATEKQGAAAEKASGLTNLLGGSLVSIVGKMAAWQVIGTMVSGVIRTFKDALSTMKEVDTASVAVQKATNFSDAQIESLTDTVYSLSSAYGKLADETMETAAVFGRAGYTDQIEQLTELSLLTQNVGDLEADTASSFLLAVDAAYDLNGSYSDLMRVIDGLNNITNNNATDMSKMTEGVTVAASVFANAGESIDTFAALLGTATATTQRSGSEMARGLRTVVMNIRQIKGELDDGEIVDADSISNAAAALKEVGIETMDETGQLRKTSEVLAELAGIWDSLGANSIAKISEALGGKRQANVVTSIMDNWDMVEKMVTEYAEGAGSALEENELYMDSWEAKTNQLSSAWTEFISKLVDTDLVKGGASAITGLLGGLNDSMTSSLVMAKEASDELNQSLDEFSDGSRYDELINKTDALTQAEKRELAVLEALKRAREDEAQAAKDAVYQEWQNTYGTELHLGGDLTGDKEALNELSTELDDVTAEFFNSNDVTAYKKGLNGIVSEFGDMYESLIKFRDEEGIDLPETQDQFLALYEAMALSTNEFETSGDAMSAMWDSTYTSALAAGYGTEQAISIANNWIDQYAKKLNGLEANAPEIEYTDNSAEAINNAAAVGEAADAVAGTRDIIFSVHEGRAGVGFGLGENTNTNSVLEKYGAASASGTKNAPGGPTLVNEQGPELISANGLAYIAGGGKPTVTNLAKGAIVLTASETRRAVGGLNSISPMRAYAGGTGISQEEIDSFKSGKAAAARSSTVQTVEDLWARFTGAPSGESSGGSSKSSSGSSGSGYYEAGNAAAAGPDFEALQDELDKTLDNLDLQIKLAQNQNDTAKELSLQATAAEKIKDLVQQYQAAGYSSTSDEVLKLLNKGYGYSDDIMSQLVTAIEDAADATSAANSLEEKRLKAEEANTALSNAQKQRTVRIFNAETGQWEWIADAGKVKSAQESLKSAQEDYRSEQQDRLIDAVKNANLGDLGSLVLGEGILTNLKDNPELMSAFANALGAVSGAAEKTAGASGESIYKSSDSHDTIYEFPGGITLTEEQAANTTLKELAEQLRVLKLV